MTAYVRVRKHEELVTRIDQTGYQVEVAHAANLTVQRLNNIYTGTKSVIEVRKARALEDALGVPHGTYFEAVDATLLAPYVHAADPDPDGPAEYGDPGGDPGASTPADMPANAATA